ncbi:MAG: flagellar export protein FliJ [Oscillospiraceae bacterium]|nr:flagellar export protein FliJ [Oscillospiraceae bacterium]
MKKFNFTLKKMRDYKRQILEGEKGYLLTLYSEYNSLEKRYDDLNTEMRNVCLEASEAMKSGISVREIQVYEMKKASIRREQAQLRIQMNVMESSVEKQRKVVVSMSQEISGLDKLEEKQRAEYNYLANKESEQMIEEFLSFKMSKGSDESFDTGEM